jgi:acetyl esterase
MTDTTATSGVLAALQPILDAVRVRPPFDYSRPVADLRAEGDAGAAVFRMLYEPIPKTTTTDHVVPVDGGSIAVRVYRPSDVRPLPALVYFHGGGWWVGNLAMADPIAAKFAHALGSVVVSVEYRLAPEHPWPAPVEDCYASVTWTRENAGLLGIDPDDISVSGTSAGGNLAAAVALMCRDRGGPPLRAQWLDVPATDLTLPEHPSLVDCGAGYGLDVADIRKCVEFYAPPDPTHAYVSPLHADDLRGLPPAVITTAEFDPLRDQGEAYAARLEEAGVSVRLTRWAGHLHGTMGLSALTPTAQDYESEVVEAMAAARAASA